MDYCQLKFTLKPLLPGREILIAELDEFGFDSFVETDDGLEAYVEGEGISDVEIEGLTVFTLPETTVSYTKKMLPRENWNAKWESDFQSIAVEDQVVIRAPFHEASNAPYDIIIQPKMSFGTGHHDTTWLMMRHMLDLDLRGKHVLDMGSGTGVLAILAEKRGAQGIDAIDIDDWAAENCDENAALNRCTRVAAEQGDARLLADRNYDVILANINRNVLTKDMPVYSAQLNEGGTILFSGFFPSDIPLIEASGESNGLTSVGHWQRNGWACLRMEKQA